MSAVDEQEARAEPREAPEGSTEASGDPPAEDEPQAEGVAPPMLAALRARLASVYAPALGWLGRHARAVSIAERWLRALVVALAFFYGARIFLRVVGAHYPVRQWLFWHYAGFWAGALLFGLACLSSGARVLDLLGRVREGIREQLVMAFGSGMLVFFLATFVAGMVGLLRPALFWALPLGLLASGGRPFWRLLRGAARLVCTLGRGPRRASLGIRLLDLAALTAGAVGLMLVYVVVLHPENALFDARWYHLGIAEHYVAEGAIRRFPEGWYVGAYPHLASVLYTWAMLLPLGQLFDRVGLCAHVELVIFLFTLLGVSVLARRLVPTAQVRHGWVVMMLFPGLYLYDSSLGMGADHVAAFFGPPVFLAMLRAWRDQSARAWVLAAAMLSGPVLTKYSAVSLVLFPMAALVLLLLWRVVRAVAGESPGGFRWQGPLAGLLAGIALTSPHWLKNWLWYGNPVYPLAPRLFANRPWSPAATERLRLLMDVNSWAPEGTTREKVKETLEALYKFSFEPHDWPKFHGSVPVFGSLLTLCLLALPFLRKTGRVWALAVATHVGVFFWYWSQHEDRYLQALLPWMAAVTAAVLALAWRTHWLARLGAMGVVALQVIWGGDVFFIPAHAQLHQGVLKATSDLIVSGYRKKYDDRFEVFESYAAIGELLPRGARLLLHENNPRLGIGAPVVSDAALFQGGLVYGTMKDPGELYDALRSMGVTHVAWRKGTSKAWDSLSGDLLFHELVTRHLDKPRSKGGWTVGALGHRPSRADGPAEDVLYLGCATSYKQGIYPRTALAVPGRGKKVRFTYPKPQLRIANAEEAAAHLGEVRYIVHEPKCFKKLPDGVAERFDKVVQRKGRTELWILKDASGAPFEPAARSSGDKPEAPNPHEPSVDDDDLPDVTDIE